MEKVFRNADISGEINVDGQNLENLRFAVDVALSKGKKTKIHGKTLKQSELRRSKSWPKNTQGKDKPYSHRRYSN